MSLESNVPPSTAPRPVVVADALLFGGTGLVGAALLRQAARGTLRVEAITRAAQPPAELAGLARWHCGEDFDLQDGRGPWPAARLVLSAGPLDGFAQWLSRAPLDGIERVVALGSTSVHTKQASPDAEERALAARLRHAESVLAERCERAGIAWTVLRPTLIWGDGRDRNVSRLARLAKRYRGLALPAFARGLRQPIHAGDVAAAMLAAVGRSESAGRCLDLPGGEVLTYLDMARRIVAAMAPRGRVVLLPGALVRTTVRLAARLGLLEPAARAVVERMAEDLVFDTVPARVALGIEPDGFRPTAADFRDA